MKGKITSFANYGDTDYICVKKTDKLEKPFFGFLLGLGLIDTEIMEIMDVGWFFGLKERGKKKGNYLKSADKHTFYKNKMFKMHIVLGKDNIHFLITTKNRKKLSDTLEKHFDFVKVKK